ncbi:MAG: hypothetical protein IIC72_06460, partial [Acidobacteria bacterium]|nr:hypothetical protein [Acidobacteriota bacterium]
MTARVAEPMNNYFTGQEVRGFPPKKINIVQCIQNHLSSILLISLCCAVMGATAVWFKVSPLYHAEAKIHFEPVVSKILYNLDKASIAPYYDDYVRTQINIIKSYPILAKSINNYENLEFKWRLSGENLSHAVNRLSTILNVQQIRGTHLLSISMSSTTNMGLADFINIIVFSYMDQLKKNQLAKDSSSLSFLEERKVLLEQELDKKYAELQKTAKKETIGATDERNIYVYLQSVVDIKQALVKARTDRSKMTANLQELRKQKQQLNEIDVSGDVDDWVEKDAAIKDNRIQMSRKLQQMRITFAGMKKDHPDRIQFEKSFEKLVEVQNQMRKRVSEKAESVIRGKMLADQNRLILKVKADYMAAIKIEINLKEELVQAEHKAMDINDKMIRGSTLRKGIKRIQDSLLRIDERADHLEVESRSPGRAQLMDRAQKPVWPSTSRRNKFMLLAGAISLVAGVVFATAREKMDNKVRTTLDIERILGMPPTGFLFDVQDLPEKIERPDKVVLEQPSSIITEQ